MEAFFHTFEALKTSYKQIVITSDVPPRQLDGFEDRLKSRLEWGLVTDVKPPELETRIAILRKKAAFEEIAVPDDVLEYIAARVSSNIRELEGALLRVTAFANLTNQTVGLKLAMEVLSYLVNDQVQEITPALIVTQTASYFGMTVDDLCSATKARTVVYARHIAMYLCRELTELTLKAIGEVFNRDHTTVISANQKITKRMTEQASTFAQVTELTTRIKDQ